MIRLRTRKGRGEGGRGTGCPAGSELDYNSDWNGRSCASFAFFQKEPRLSRGNEV
jgi:hypothetical protein